MAILKVLCVVLAAVLVSGSGPEVKADAPWEDGWKLLTNSVSDGGRAVKSWINRNGDLYTVTKGADGATSTTFAGAGSGGRSSGGAVSTAFSGVGHAFDHFAKFSEHSD